MSIDLLPVGEQLAELDLVVRQLDDGSLTVTTDDTRPDGERVHIAAAGRGLRAWLPVAKLAPGQASRTAAALGPLNQAIAEGGGRGALIVRGDEVRFEVGLDHPAPYGDDELRALYQAAADGGAQQREAVARIVAETTPPAFAAPAEEPAAELPSSFLRGAGQRPRESATERFGALGKTPGRGELAPEDRASHHRPQGGGGGALIVVGLLGLAGAGGAVALFLRPTSGPETDAPPVVESTAPAPAPAGDAPDAPAPDGEPPAAPTVSGRPATPTAAPDEATPAAAATRAPAAPTRPAAPAVSEEDLLARARDPETRLAAVEDWLLHGVDARPGARRRMLEALGDGVEADGKVGRLVVHSLRERPPSVAEAIECLAVARGGVKRALVSLLGDAAGDDARAAAEALAKVTPDLQVDEALLKLGRPRPGAVLRLANERGADWVLFGDGNLLLADLARRDLKQVASLLEHGDPEVRIYACSLIAAREEQQREAVAILAPVLRDAEPRVRARAAEGLAALRDPRASWPLARALAREDSSQTRDVITGALQRLPLRETIELLQKLQGNQEAGDRRAAVLGLAAIGKPEAIGGLVAALRDADRTVRLEALRALDVAHGKRALRPRVAEGLPAIRELGLDRRDREVWSIARQLHYQITGRMPDETVRDRGAQ